MDHEYDVCLVDDGTMDTVIEVNHERWTEPQTFRYDSGEMAAYRDESGCLDLDTFTREVVVPDAEMEE